MIFCGMPNSILNLSFVLESEIVAKSDQKKRIATKELNMICQISFMDAKLAWCDL